MSQKSQKKNSPGAWPVAYKWVAMGTLAVYTAIGQKTIAVAYAADARAGLESPMPESMAQTALPPRRFDIPAGLLDQVIEAFRTATGLQVSFDKEAIRSLQSPGVSGTFPPDEALIKLLTGTGAAFKFTGTNSVVIELRAAGSSIDVTDQVAPTSAKYTEPLVDIPQTITIVPRAIMEQQGVQTLTDALRNVTGLTITAGEGGAAAGDNLMLRGFSARNDIFVDGVRDMNPQTRDSFNMEQVEVVKGPQSAFAGRGSAGGTINVISKTANLNRMVGGSVLFGNAGQKRVTADLNSPLKFLGERSAGRLNLMFTDGGIPGRDVVNSKRYGLAPTLSFGLGTSDRLTLNYYKLKQSNISDYGIPWVPATNNVLVAYRDQPAPVPRNTFYGYADRDREYMNTDMGTIRYEHDFSDTVTIRNQFRYNRSSRNSIATPPRFASNDSTVINREMRSWIAEDETIDNQTDLRARFKTGFLEHAVVAGTAFSREGNIRQNRTAPNAPTTLLDPNPNDVYPGTLTVNPNIGNIVGKTQAVYAFDTIRFGQHLEATGGARWERFDASGINTTPTQIARVDKMTSTRAGLIYKPIQRGSIYASYGTSMSPSLEGLSYSTVDVRVPPEKTYTLEFGTKWEVSRSRLLLAAAYFDVKKDNARTPGVNPEDPPQLVGKQKVNGFELSATGAITRTLRILAGYTFMNSKIAESQTAAEVGKFFINTPRNSGTVWATYQYKKLLVGAGPRFIGQRYGNNTNTRKVDSYWTLDLMGTYPIHRHMDLRFNVSNLNNAFYFDRLGGGHVIPGQARNVMGTAAFHF